MKRRRAILISVLLLAALGALWLWREGSRQKRFAREIQTAAKRYGVDPLLVKAVVWRESKFDAGVRGRAQELGLMQLQEIAAQEWADAERIRTFQHEHCLDPGTNTLAGTFYLGKLLKRYAHTDNPVPYALADYNAGRGNVVKWNNGEGSTNSVVFLEQIRFPGTRDYIRTVTRQYRWYQTLSAIGWN